MIEIDGRAGGGQIVRTALSLAMLTSTPTRITNVRGGRPNPGLRPQHLAAVRVAAACCEADVEGASEGSEELAFGPGAVTGGEHEIDVGTAGSVTLLFDTLLALSPVLDETLTVTVTGGTDVKWSPTMAHYRTVKLPLVSRFGFEADVALHRTGFYPTGGGRATLRVEPGTAESASVTERGPLEAVTVHSKAAESLADADVADRQADAVVEALEDRDVPVGEVVATYVDAASAGSALLLRAAYRHTVAGFDALGERGITSEAVAERAVEAFDEFREGHGAVDRHTADQLMLPLTVGGGRVAIPAITDHVETNREVLRAFGGDLRVERSRDGPVLASDGDLFSAD
jgi:RNA 3'-terminal phosphate cyclase (ATP)